VFKFRARLLDVLDVRHCESGLRQTSPASERGAKGHSRGVFKFRARLLDVLARRPTLGVRTPTDQPDTGTGRERPDSRGVFKFRARLLDALDVRLGEPGLRQTSSHRNGRERPLKRGVQIPC
jgi:hypothetical protein